MEMTDVYWLLISYYLNLAASKKAIHAHFTCKWKGGVVGRGGKKDGKAVLVVVVGSLEVLGRQRAQ